MTFKKSLNNPRIEEYEAYDAPPAYTPVASSLSIPTPAPAPVSLNTDTSSIPDRSNYQNQTHRGPIGSLINFAFTNVAKATSRAVSHTNNSSTRAALGIVEDFVSNRMDKREKRQERRQEKKALRK